MTTHTNFHTMLYEQDLVVPMMLVITMPAVLVAARCWSVRTADFHLTGFNLYMSTSTKNRITIIPDGITFASGFCKQEQLEFRHGLQEKLYR
eukprot:5857707-Amphidinium_carterae.1